MESDIVNEIDQQNTDLQRRISPSEHEAAGLFLDFFIGLFNSVLYKRPNKVESEFFRSNKIFSLDLPISRHPDVARYIEECSKKATSFVIKNAMDGVYLNFITRSNVVLQRFVLKLAGKWKSLLDTEDENVFILESVRAGLKQILTRLNDPQLLSKVSAVEKMARFEITFGFGKCTTLESFNKIVVPAFKEDPDLYSFPWPTWEIDYAKSKCKTVTPGKGSTEASSQEEVSLKVESLHIDNGPHKKHRINNDELHSGRSHKCLKSEDINPIIPILFPIDTIILAKCLVFNLYVLTYPDVQEGGESREKNLLQSKKESSKIGAAECSPDCPDDRKLQHAVGLQSEEPNTESTGAVTGKFAADTEETVPGCINLEEFSRESSEPGKAKCPETLNTCRLSKRQVDPARLLSCLSPLLDTTTGAIKSAKVVPTLLRIMSRFSKKMMNKCTFINILNSTSSDLIEIFLEKGGWDVLHIWTRQSKEKNTHPLTTELLLLLLKIPMNASRLRQNNIKELIKELSLNKDDGTVRSIALKISTTWDIIINQDRGYTPTSSSLTSTASNNIPELNTIYPNVLTLQKSNVNSEAKNEVAEKGLLSDLNFPLEEIPAEYFADIFPPSSEDQSISYSLDMNLFSEVSNAILAIQHSPSEQTSKVDDNISVVPANAALTSPHNDSIINTNDNPECEIFPGFVNSGWAEDVPPEVQTEIETVVTESFANLSEMTCSTSLFKKNKQKQKKIPYDEKLLMEPRVVLVHLKMPNNATSVRLRRKSRRHGKRNRKRLRRKPLLKRLTRSRNKKFQKRTSDPDTDLQIPKKCMNNEGGNLDLETSSNLPGSLSIEIDDLPLKGVVDGLRKADLDHSQEITGPSLSKDGDGIGIAASIGKRAEAAVADDSDKTGGSKVGPSKEGKTDLATREQRQENSAQEIERNLAKCNSLNPSVDSANACQGSSRRSRNLNSKTIKTKGKKPLDEFGDEMDQSNGSIVSLKYVKVRRLNLDKLSLSGGTKLDILEEDSGTDKSTSASPVRRSGRTPRPRLAYDYDEIVGNHKIAYEYEEEFSLSEKRIQFAGLRLIDNEIVTLTQDEAIEVANCIPELFGSAFKGKVFIRSSDILRKSELVEPQPSLKKPKVLSKSPKPESEFLRPFIPSVKVKSRSPLPKTKLLKEKKPEWAQAKESKQRQKSPKDWTEDAKSANSLKAQVDKAKREAELRQQKARKNVSESRIGQPKISESSTSEALSSEDDTNLELAKSNKSALKHVDESNENKEGQVNVQRQAQIKLKNASFIDLIGIPGAAEKVDKPIAVPTIAVQKKQSVPQLDKSNNEIDCSAIADKVKARPKVFSTKRSRTEGLLEEMTKTDEHDEASASQKGNTDKTTSSNVDNSDSHKRKKEKRKKRHFPTSEGDILDEVPLEKTPHEGSGGGVEDGPKQPKIFKGASERMDTAKDMEADGIMIIEDSSPGASGKMTSKDVNRKDISTPKEANRNERDKSRDDKIREKVEKDYQNRMKMKEKKTDLGEIEEKTQEQNKSSASGDSPVCLEEGSESPTPAPDAGKKSIPIMQSCVFDEVLRSNAMEIDEYKYNKLSRRKQKQERRASLTIKPAMEKHVETPKETELPTEGRTTSLNTDGTLKSILVIHRGTKLNKSVRWKNTYDLEKMHYFELDASERVNVTRRDFAQMQKLEKVLERKAMKSQCSGSTDAFQLWTPPRPISFPASFPSPVVRSKEKDIQETREKIVLGTIYFWKKDIPFSADEPDPAEGEPAHAKPATQIAMERKKSILKDYTDFKWPTPVVAEAETSHRNEAPFIQPVDSSLRNSNSPHFLSAQFGAPAPNHETGRRSSYQDHNERKDKQFQADRERDRQRDKDRSYQDDRFRKTERKERRDGEDFYSRRKDNRDREQKEKRQGASPHSVNSTDSLPLPQDNASDKKRMFSRFSESAHAFTPQVPVLGPTSQVPENVTTTGFSFSQPAELATSYSRETGVESTIHSSYSNIQFANNYYPGYTSFSSSEFSSVNVNPNPYPGYISSNDSLANPMIGHSFSSNEVLQFSSSQDQPFSGNPVEIQVFGEQYPAAGTSTEVSMSDGGGIQVPQGAQVPYYSQFHPNFPNQIPVPSSETSSEGSVRQPFKMVIGPPQKFQNFKRN